MCLCLLSFRRDSNALSLFLQALEAVAGAGTARVVSTAEEAASGVDFVYADSWMSYGVSGEERDKRMATLMPYQVMKNTC